MTISQTDSPIFATGAIGWHSSTGLISPAEKEAEMANKEGDDYRIRLFHHQCISSARYRSLKSSVGNVVPSGPASASANFRPRRFKRCLGTPLAMCRIRLIRKV